MCTILSSFAAKVLPNLSLQELQEYDAFIHKHHDVDLFNWLSGSVTAPAEVSQSKIFGMLTNHCQRSALEK